MGCFMAAPLVHAAEPATANVLQLGLGFRYGFDMKDEKPNPWGVGVGIDGGYTLPNAVYLGGTFEYFFGGTEETPDVDVKANVWQLLAEGGYDIGLADELVLRPKLAAGLAMPRVELCSDVGGCDHESSGKFALAPGVKLMILSRIKLMIDARYALVFGENQPKGLILSAGVGL